MLSVKNRADGKLIPMSAESVWVFAVGRVPTMVSGLAPQAPEMMTSWAETYLPCFGSPQTVDTLGLAYVTRNFQLWDLEARGARRIPPSLSSHRLGHFVIKYSGILRPKERN